MPPASDQRDCFCLYPRRAGVPFGLSLYSCGIVSCPPAALGGQGCKGYSLVDRRPTNDQCNYQVD